MDFVSVLWSIWLTRNKAILNNEVCNPLNIIHTAHHWKNRWIKGNLLAARAKPKNEDSNDGGSGSLEQSTDSNISRVANQDNVTVIIDDAWKKNKLNSMNTWRAAVGWIIKDKDVVIDRGKALVFASTPTQTEAMTALMAIKKFKP